MVFLWSVRTPHFGGHIERLIGTQMGEVHLLPGTSFSNIKEKGDYDAEGEACLTLEEFERWLAIQISVYHNTIHSALNAIAGRIRHKLRVRYNPRNLSIVYLENVDGTCQAVPYRDLRRPPVTKFEHDRATEELRINFAFGEAAKKKGRNFQDWPVSKIPEISGS